MNRSVNGYLRSILVAAGCIVFCFRFSAARDLTVDEILSRMETADESSRAVRFNFTQTITYSLTGETQAKSGEIVFKKPDYIRIEQKKPAEQLMVCDGKKIWVYTPAYAQAVVDKWSNWRKNNELAYTFLSITRSFKQFESQYKFSYVSKGAKGILFDLSPGKSGLPKMRLVVDETSFIPVQTTVFLENVVITSDVHGLEINPELGKDIFKFSVPKKTQIIELK